MAPHKGHYHDALYVKRLRVIMLLVEATGGISPAARAHISIGSRAAPRAEARPTAPGTAARASPPSPSTVRVHCTEYVHHSALADAGQGCGRLSGYNAKAMRKKIICLKQSVCTGAADAAGGDGAHA